MKERRASIINGNCLAVLRAMPCDFFDSIVTDPPYGISFMAKKWDYDVPSVEVWKECLRVLKPGGHMLVACGTRTQHRMVVNIEDAGFEIRDVVTWLYGQGFPKSQNIALAIDKQEAGTVPRGKGFNVAGQDRELNANKSLRSDHPDYVPPQLQSDAARQWEGWGTALKPACEFWTLARKPLSESTVAKNVLKWGTGGINVDATRISVSEDEPNKRRATGEEGGADSMFGVGNSTRGATLTQGRFPANLILSEQAAAALDGQSGIAKPKPARTGKRGGCNPAFMSKEKGNNAHQESEGFWPADEGGGASRFFYVAKASKSERNAGLEERAPTKVNDGRATPIDNPFQRGETQRLNTHPTVKPFALMRYLCRLITKPHGIVLDPFAGSGSTGIGAIREGFRFIGIELDPEYASIARNRIDEDISQ